LIVVPNFIELPVWYIQLIAFTLLTIAIFDLAYNKFRGLAWDYLGDNWWDNAIKKVPFHFMLFARLICLVVGTFLIINQ
jgi:hypothetical protein